MAMNKIIVIIGIILLTAGVIWALPRATLRLQQLKKTGNFSSLINNNQGNQKDQNIKINTNLPENVLPQQELGKTFQKNNFSFKYANDWEEVTAPKEILGMIVNKKEAITDNLAKKLNFQTYLTVSLNNSGVRNFADFITFFKSELKKKYPETNLSNDKTLTINNRESSSLEMNINQKGLKIKVQIYLIKGNNNDVWVLSFNTLESNYSKVQNLFEKISASFTIK